LGDLVRELEKSATNKELAKAVPLIFNFHETPGDKTGWTQGKFGESYRVWSLIYLAGLETNLKLLKAGL